MISREIIKSTRNIIIQHLVFGSTHLTGNKAATAKTTTSPTTSSKGKFTKGQRHKSTSTASSGNSGIESTASNASNSLKKSVLNHMTQYDSLKGKTNTYDWEIFGHESQVIQLHLNPGTSITAETGALLEMSATMEMDTTARGGFMSSMKRMITGQGIFLTKFKNSSDTETARITFSSPYISKILAIQMSEIGGELICKKNAFLCGDNDIEIGPRLTNRFSIGFFGGQGFILQKLTGHGLAFIHGSGSIMYRMLKPMETIKVSTGCIVAFEPTIQYDIEWVKGAKNIFFGGEGLFLATLSGPGLVILQSLPFEKLVSAIASHLPSSSTIVSSSGSSGSSDTSGSSSSSSSKST
ncbi:hypothetical protein PPL_02679 [Heterostelium album PN500]|uniref:Altered inheritance of mitochondria protein 24, mitochondrial n=1 Tax=Heterostelium pallidum (strain ATCC 26659 / Pp 5 / PN500) TaxID=670386 RepID=D3B2R5_HETP5|nr:hypothetical protein PPL_02679 [Heterostelium album PN500]EFA83613.1 hypothetical protein PPL_02679 [Heterostelium album PN500]|eukprot:XP_020435730.1 hypothetical protein PPL_02679 [Heterostelium album PN500]